MKPYLVEASYQIEVEAKDERDALKKAQVKFGEEAHYGDEFSYKIATEDLKIEVSRIHKLDGASATKAFCDISIADSFMIKGLRIVEGEKGLFIVMPREEGKDGKFYNVVIPLTREVKDEIERVVLEAYGA